MTTDVSPARPTVNGSRPRSADAVVAHMQSRSGCVSVQASDARPSTTRPETPSRTSVSTRQASSSCRIAWSASAVNGIWSTGCTPSKLVISVVRTPGWYAPLSASTPSCAVARSTAVRQQLGTDRPSEWRDGRAGDVGRDAVQAPCEVALVEAVAGRRDVERAEVIAPKRAAGYLWCRKVEHLLKGSVGLVPSDRRTAPNCDPDAALRVHCETVWKLMVIGAAHVDQGSTPRDQAAFEIEVENVNAPQACVDVVHEARIGTPAEAIGDRDVGENAFEIAVRIEAVERPGALFR